MELKRGFYFFTIFLLLVGLISQVYATLPDEVPFADQTKQAGNIIEEKRWEFVGEQWKELLLKNSFVKPVDSAFRASDTFFVILFARHYDLTLEMFFVFLLWLFTVIWIKSAAGAITFSRNEVARWIIAILVTSIIAHLQIFNKIALVMWKIMFYRTGALWSFLIFVVLIVFLVLYLYLGRILATYLKRAQEIQEKAQTRHDVRVLKAADKGEERATS